MMLCDYCKTLPQYLVPKHALTRFAGFVANSKIPPIKNYLITRFIQSYHVNMAEAFEENPRAYACFNDFFIRHLKPGLRPLADADILSPVDGCVSELGSICQGQLLQAKGRYYSVQELLAAKDELCQPFVNGHFATFYLSPKDYHRIHMPTNATLRYMIHVPGQLFSVQPATARVVPQLFARNERLVVFFDTPMGLMAMVLVGAAIVGAIGTIWQGDLKRPSLIQTYPCSDYALADKTLAQGAEMGHFKLGSTVVLLFAKDMDTQWLDTLKAGDTVKYGQAIGSFGA